MIDRQQATTIMQAWMTAHPANSPHDPLELWLLDEHTLEEDFGWVFFYTSKLFHETGDYRYALAGNAPMIVDRSEGSIQPTGTAYPISHYLAEYRHRRGLLKP
jgi:hypothetical protein